MAIRQLEVIAIPKTESARSHTGPDPIRAVVHSMTCERCLDGVSILQVIFDPKYHIDVSPMLKRFLTLHRRYHEITEKRHWQNPKYDLEAVRILDELKAMKKDLAMITEHYDIRGNPPTIQR